ncbi:MAG: M14 family metallopeptidase, partial [Steroidobacteraceae bacterium]
LTASAVGTARAALLVLGLALGCGASAQQLAPLPFDRILRHDELGTLLRQWAEARPQLVKLESLGKTPQDRDMWFLTLTNAATGPAQEKPALLVDGNMHATEWAGGVAALHFVHALLEGYGGDERVTRLLDTRAVYVLPRMTPDGVDATLEQGRFIRSADRPYPSAKVEPGIIPRDVNGDGRTVFMRFRDPNGPWKTHAGDPRLLVPRAPDEAGGDYWRVMQEGMVEGYDGVTIADEPEHEALDFGANFPGDRGTAVSQTDGPYPTSVPEVAAYVAAIASRPNIVAHVTCHTFGGLVLTPPVNLGERLPEADRQAYATLAGRAAALTGYTAISYLDLRSVDREQHIPSAFGWLYNRRGIYSFITEFWNPLTAAGISLENTTASAWLWGFHPVEDELKLLRWSDKHLDGDGFLAWRSFDHPQLGPVEIGGFDLIRYWYNVPFDRLEQEVAPHSEWLVYLGLSTPRLSVRSFTAEPAGVNLWRLRLAVENTGWLPTHGTQQALDMLAVDGVSAELKLPAEAKLVEGDASQQLGQLAGRTGQRSTATWWGFTAGTPDRAVADWIVSAPAGTTVAVRASHERAGSAHAELVLGASPD